MAALLSLLTPVYGYCKLPLFGVEDVLPTLSGTTERRFSGQQRRERTRTCMTAIMRQKTAYWGFIVVSFLVVVAFCCSLFLLLHGFECVWSSVVARTVDQVVEKKTSPSAFSDPLVLTGIAAGALLLVGLVVLAASVSISHAKKE